MRKNSNEVSTGAAVLMTIGIMLFIGFIISATTPECSMSGCDNDAKESGRYCYLHDLSYRTYGNADYNAVYENSQKRRECASSDSGTTSESTSSSSSDKKTSALSATTSSASRTTSNSSGSTKSTSSSNSTSSSSKAYNSYNSYDEGYEDVYDNDDYDWDRYWSDSDYADGVDDAMEDADW